MTETLPDTGSRVPDPKYNPISLIGSTGSIGRQTLETAQLLGLRVCALSAGSNIGLLEEQTRRFRPSVAAVFDESAARDFKSRVRDMDVQVFAGAEGLIEAARADGRGGAPDDGGVGFGRHACHPPSRKTVSCRAVPAARQCSRMRDRRRS